MPRQIFFVAFNEIRILPATPVDFAATRCPTAVALKRIGRNLGRIVIECQFLAGLDFLPGDQYNLALNTNIRFATVVETFSIIKLEQVLRSEVVTIQNCDWVCAEM